MKTPSADLFNLIHSLGKAEKRYLKLRAGDPPPDYWLLFVAFAELDFFDEKHLSQRYPNAGFLKNLPVNKRYLEHWILDQLDRFRKKNMEESCWDRLDQIRTWLDRHFFDKAYAELKKLRKRATGYELFDIQLQCCRLEKLLLGKIQTLPSNPKTIETLFHAEQRCLNSLTNLNQYWFVLNRLYEIQRRQERSFTELEKWGKHPLLQNEEAASSLQSKIFFHQAKAIYAFTKGDGKLAMQSNQATLDLLDANPKLIRLLPERYLSTLNNYLVDCLEAGRNDLLQSGLKQLRALPDRKEFKSIARLEANVFRQSYMLEINQILREKRYPEGLRILPGLESGLLKYGKSIARHHRISMHFLGGYLCFLNGNMEKAQSLLQPLARSEREDVVLEILRYARLLFLLTHFEMGHDELVDSLLESFRRSGKKGKKRMKAEAWLLRFIRQSITHGRRIPDQSELEVLRKLREDPAESRFFQYIDLEFWLKQKMRHL
ncbi:MAG: hypothetical protein GYB31_16855 [Bacteroidetes bacterium]|nr:hypothetical protein [Bacteroidota bacterium]